jgi:hypothetical protein
MRKEKLVGFFLFEIAIFERSSVHGFFSLGLEGEGFDSRMKAIAGVP